MLKVSVEYFDAQMFTGNAPVLTAGPWALFYAGAPILPNLSKVLVVHSSKFKVYSISS